jgi:elongation factor G
MKPDATRVFPVYLKIEPKTAHDQTNLIEALKRFAIEDPSFRVDIDPESGETILSGQGELHLDLKVQLLIQEHGIGVLTGAPQVAYRETLARPADIDYTHHKRAHGIVQYARVILDLEPNGKDQGNVFENTIAEGAVPIEIIQAVEKGVRSVWDNGVLIGYPIVDMKVSLYDAAYHEADSSAVAFVIAARAAMKEGCEKGGIQILEPIMKVEIGTPADCVNRVLSNINGRRGQIFRQEMRGLNTVIYANVPLANMFGYVSDLRGLTNGCGTFDMHYDHYALMPCNITSGPDGFPPAVGMRA